MKKKISLLLAMLLLITFVPSALAKPRTVDATKNTKKIILDGEEVMVGSYTVERYNYLKLRDVAALLSGKNCQFNVGYDKEKELVMIYLDNNYTKLEGDLVAIKNAKAKAFVESKKFLVNGEEKELKTAVINRYNYIQLRDLASLIGLGVDYDAKTESIILNSNGEIENKEENKDNKDNKDSKISDEDELAGIIKYREALIKDDAKLCEEAMQLALGWDKIGDYANYFHGLSSKAWKHSKTLGFDLASDYKEIKKSIENTGSHECTRYEFIYDQGASLELSLYRELPVNGDDTYAGTNLGVDVELSMSYTEDSYKKLDAKARNYFDRALSISNDFITCDEQALYNRAFYDKAYNLSSNQYGLDEETCKNQINEELKFIKQFNFNANNVSKKIFKLKLTDLDDTEYQVIYRDNASKVSYVGVWSVSDHGESYHSVAITKEFN